jgi:hypothetical protein
MSDAELLDFIMTEVQALGIEVPAAQVNPSAKRWSERPFQHDFAAATADYTYSYVSDRLRRRARERPLFPSFGHKMHDGT